MQLQVKNKTLDEYLSESQSELMVKDKELLKLKEDNRLLQKQFSQKKKKIQQFSQVITNTL